MTYYHVSRTMSCLHKRLYCPTISVLHSLLQQACNSLFYKRKLCCHFPVVFLSSSGTSFSSQHHTASSRSDPAYTYSTKWGLWASHPHCSTRLYEHCFVSLGSTLSPMYYYPAPHSIISTKDRQQCELVEFCRQIFSLCVTVAVQRAETRIC